jgi:energy-coupling factor transporter ATP-binding protein EcfA2
MLLTKLSIANYKSYFEKVDFEFSRGFNILLGANSSGKTTVLEAIRFFDADGSPHRSVANIVDIDTPWHAPSEITATFSLKLSELQKLLPTSGIIVPISLPAGERIASNLDIEKYWKTNPFDISFIKKGSAVQAQYFPLGKFVVRRGPGTSYPRWDVSIQHNEIRYPEGMNGTVGSDGTQEINSLAVNFHSKIYKFSSERQVRANCTATEPKLLPNASNLAYCINHLRSDDSPTFEDLRRYINKIFPQIYDISSVAKSDNNFYLSVITTPANLRRNDLKVPIDQVGTGIFNAIAILYVVLTSRTQHIILLEEPNSYLHPRALKELLAILAEAGPQHQFFITTHSSDVLRNVPASTVTLLEHNGITTSAKQTREKDLFLFRTGLLDLGIKLTDLHGCDRVLWVEGETEEYIFPKILTKYFPDVAQGIAVLKVHGTGDFESKKYSPRKVAEIYRRLSDATFLAPPMVAITLDMEDRSREEIDSILRDTDGLVHILPKPMIEDFLLSPEAIQAVLESDLDRSVDLMEIKECLERLIQDPANRFRPSSKGKSPMHAAKVLEAVFQALGGSGAYYKKTRHGPMLMDWLLESKPEHLDGLIEWFRNFIR